MTETPHPWDRLPTETLKAHTAFLEYIALGARRSVRAAARQRHQTNVEAASSGSKVAALSTITRRWLGWSARHSWVSRANERDTWIESASNEQIVINILACKLALVTRAHDFLTSPDSEVFLRGARAFTLQHPPVQRVEDVTRIEDLPDVSDEQLERMKEIRDERREAKKEEK